MPFRCPVCDHVTDDYPDDQHCRGCGRALGILKLEVIPDFDSSTQCYNCWLKSSKRCNFVLQGTEVVIERMDGMKVTSEIERLWCPSCGAMKTGVPRLLSRERDVEEEIENHLVTAEVCIVLSYFLPPFLPITLPLTIYNCAQAKMKSRSPVRNRRANWILGWACLLICIWVVIIWRLSLT